MMDAEPNQPLGLISGALVALLVWVICSQQYGFLGFALGWMPAVIVGGIAGVVIMLFWRFIVGLIFLLAVGLAALIYFNNG